MKIFKGKVIKKMGDKTATVAVTSVVEHPMYKKRYKVTKNYQVHDEFGSKVGQQVEFVASRPYSKLKKWKTIEIENKKTKKNKRRKKK